MRRFVLLDDFSFRLLRRADLRETMMEFGRSLTLPFYYLVCWLKGEDRVVPSLRSWVQIREVIQQSTLQRLLLSCSRYC
ncbi:MAG: hypothetical protein ACK4I8_01955 [Armatimonadota bacterium]